MTAGIRVRPTGWGPEKTPNHSPNPATAKAIADAGYELAMPPKKGSDNNWQCWTHDPDGNAIEFMQIMPDSLQMLKG